MRTASSASARPAAAAGRARLLRRRSSRSSRTATWRRCGGMEASSAVRVAASGRTASGGTNDVPYSTPGSGRNTVPVSNSARSVKPRATLRCATRSRPGTRLRRRNGACPSSGFASLTLGRCVARGRAVQVVLLLGRERERGRLDVAGRGERVAHAAAALLRGGQTAARRRRREHRRDAVVPLDAGDLLGERPLVGEVGAPGRRRDDQLVAAVVDVAADEPQRADHLGRRVVDADEALHEADRQGELRAAPTGRTAHRRARRSCRRRARPSGRRRAGRRRTGHGGSTPRSKRRDASDGSLCRRAVRAIEIVSKIAASMSTFFVSGPISVVPPPMTPARPIGPDSSVISRSSGCSVRTLPSRVSSCSPSASRGAR